MSNNWIGGGESEVLAVSIHRLEDNLSDVCIISLTTEKKSHSLGATKRAGYKITGTNPVNRIYAEETCGEGMQM